MIVKTLNLFLALILAGVFFSCQLAPTKGANQGQVVGEGTQDVFQGFLQNFLKSNPVILDARTPLDFSVSHTPGAVLAQWQDFNKTLPGYRGELQDDEFSLARRLSLWGIDRETPVLVVGYGLQGQGEEGRIAWMLKYLGVKNVQFASWTMIRATIPRPETGPENKAIWLPQLQAQYLAASDEFKAAVFNDELPPSKARLKSLQLDSVNSGFLNNNSLVLDVRDLDKDESMLEKARIPVKRISWKKFINAKGLPETSVQDELKKSAINLNHKIFVISEDGVSSGAVTTILRQWGYQAKNFSGGFEFLRRAK